MEKKYIAPVVTALYYKVHVYNFPSIFLSLTCSKTCLNDVLGNNQGQNWL